MRGDINIFSAGAAKLGAFPEQLERWRSDAPLSPVTVEIQPTEQCNHRCPACQGHFPLSRSEAQRACSWGSHLNLAKLESVWESPPSGIVLSGNTGDPLPHPQIEQLLVDLRQRNLPTVLITNGEAMTPEVAEQALATCRGIRVSLDAHDAESFARAHGRRADSWARVLEAIATVVSTRARLKLHSRCRVGVGYLTKEATRTGMVTATLLARELGVDYIQFRPYHFQSHDVRREIAECRKAENGSFRVLASDQKYDQFQDQTRTYGRCHGAWFYTVIDARGDVYVCCHHVGRDEARIGSLESQRWRELLIGVHRRAVIDRFPNQSCVPLSPATCAQSGARAHRTGAGNATSGSPDWRCGGARHVPVSVAGPLALGGVSLWRSSSAVAQAVKALRNAIVGQEKTPV